MPERATIFEHVQIGLETTPGTSVPANKLLSALSIAPSAQGNIKKFRPQGTKYNTITAKGMEWTEADLSGQPTFTEIVYPLASVISAPVITTPGGGTLSRLHTFTSAAGGPDSPSTFTVETGSSVRANKFTYGIIPEFTFTFARDELSLGGSMFGRALIDPATLTATPTGIALVPILPEQLSIYLDVSSATLGTTKLLRWLSGELTISGRYDRLWVLDAAQASFVNHIETEPTVELKVKLEADAAGMALLADLRASTRKWVRVEAVGAVIETALPYKFTLD